MSETVKTFQSEEMIVSFRSDICQHAGECVRGLPKVFNINKRPWVSPQNATPEEIMSVIGRCPSGALSYQRKNEI